MTWADLSNNSGPIAHYFSNAPSLESIELIELAVMNHSPSLVLAGRVPFRPDKNNHHLDASVQSTDLVLVFYRVSEVILDGWGETVKGQLSIVRHELSKGVEFSFRADDCLFSGLCSSFDIQAVSFPSDSIAKLRKARLLSHRNVWNSCLLLAKLKGYAVTIVGQPDQSGEMGYCTWMAANDLVELKADNPIELAGLIALHEHHRPVEPKDYWWRIDGPNLLQEAQRAWEAKHFGPSNLVNG